MSMLNDIRILVYADWASLQGAALMGILIVQRVRGKEIFSFEYDPSWMRRHTEVLFLDPNLGHFRGQQYLPDDQRNFGIFLDSAPDRWGRLLMRRKEAWEARFAGRPERTLFESDFLLGVFDGHRMGGLRFKLDADGPFLNDRVEMATPPWTSLRALEHASLQLECSEGFSDPEYVRWLRLLIDPGSSLGGARPKAGVLDGQEHLWIAKFPSAHDDYDIGAWEMVLHQLAKSCGISVPQAMLQKFTGRHHTFLAKRFDRTEHHQRIHFASAMTLLGHQDGTDHQDGVGYMDLAGFIIRYSPAPNADLEQLWRRMVFNILVSNTDDHLRNHGFLLTSEGWRLSPAYDLNPNAMGTGLTLNISTHNNALDPSLALETAKQYRLSSATARQMLNDMRKIIADWATVAKGLGLSPREKEEMQPAFRAV